MGKQRKHKKINYPDKTPEPSFWYKLFRFFFPKDWKGEIAKGQMIGYQMRTGQVSPKVMPTWWLGKGIRKLIDPKRKMKVGKK